MSFNITLEPSGRTFQAEEHETLLDAALRSGLNLSYHCNSGSCGECKVKVTQGDFYIMRQADFPLTEADKIQSHVLLCSIVAQSDMHVEASEAKSAADIPRQSLSVKVTKSVQIDEHYCELHLRTPRSKTLRFLAGQSICLSGKGERSKKLAVASCPCNGMNLQIHINRDEEFPLKDFICNHLSISDTFDLEGPFGEFTFDDDSKRASVFIAYDTGFAPIKSLIEHAIALEKEQSMMLFWIMPPGRKQYQANYCRSWEDAFDCFVYIPLHVSEPAHVLFGSAESNNINPFRLLEDEILARTPVESELDLYLSGPELMTETFRRAFMGRSTPQQQIHIYEQ